MSDPIAFTVISQAGFKCPFCEKAVALLDQRGHAYALRVLKRSDLVSAANAAGMKTIPIIYHGVHLVGGYDDLVEYLDTMRNRHVS